MVLARPGSFSGPITIKAMPPMMASLVMPISITYRYPADLPTPKPGSSSLGLGFDINGFFGRGGAGGNLLRRRGRCVGCFVRALFHAIFETLDRTAQI